MVFGTYGAIFDILTKNMIIAYINYDNTKVKVKEAFIMFGTKVSTEKERVKTKQAAYANDA